MSDACKINRDYALRENRALEMTIEFMKKHGFIDDSLDVINGHDENLVAKIFKDYLDHFMYRIKREPYVPYTSGFKGAMTARRQFLEEVS